MRVAINYSDLELLGKKFSGKTLGQRLFDAAATCKYIQRISIIAPNAYRGKVFESWYRVPQVMVDSGLSITSPIFADDFSSGLKKVMRQGAWPDVVILGLHTPVVFGFLLDELVEGKESFLNQLTWSDVVNNNISLEAAGPKFTDEQLEYLYGEMDLGASYEELVAEILNTEA